MDSSLDDFLGGKVLICINVDLLGRKLLQLLEHPLLAFHVDVIRVVVIVIDGEVLAISQELIQLFQGFLAALL